MLQTHARTKKQKTSIQKHSLQGYKTACLTGNIREIKTTLNAITVQDDNTAPIESIAKLSLEASKNTPTDITQTVCFEVWIFFCQFGAALRKIAKTKNNTHKEKYKHAKRRIVSVVYLSHKEVNTTAVIA